MAGAVILLFLTAVTLIPKYSEAQVPCTGAPVIDQTRSGLRPLGTDRGSIESLCYANTQRTLIVIDCFGSPIDRREWHVNGVLDRSTTRATYVVQSGGNYTCTLINSCGQTVFPNLFPTAPPILSSMSSTPGATPIGVDSFCLDSFSSGIQSANLSCEVSNVNQSSLYATVWSRNGQELPSSINMSVIEVSTPGTYACTVRNDCGSSTTQTEVQAVPTIKKGTGTNTSAMIDVGTDSCYARDGLMIFCEVVGGINVNRTWSRDGTVLEIMADSKRTVTPSSNRNDNYTCRVQNECNYDIATTTVLRPTLVNITAMIMASPPVGTGCNRVNSPQYSMSDICPLIGENVTISCSTTEGATYTITGPQNRNVSNRNLVLVNFQPADSGIYVCTATTRCGSAVDRLNITSIAQPPMLSNGSDICLRASETTNIACNATGFVVGYSWTRNGMFLTTMQNLRGVSYGTYNCTAIGVTANASAVSRVLPFVSVALTFNSLSGNRCSELQRRPPPGTDFCAYRGDVLMLQCTASVSSVPTRIFRDGEVRLNSFQRVRFDDGGVYMCNATNECGTSTNMTIIRVYEPARIDPGKTLPIPQRGEVVAGAGMSTEPVCGRDGNKISLHCCYTGFDPPTVRWYFVYPNGTEAPVNTSDPSINITETFRNAIGNSILMIDPFRERHVGKYRCNVSNIAGNSTGDVDLIHKPDEDKQWSKGRWSSCSPDCHRGVRTRTVTCVTVSSRVVMNETDCPLPRPPTQEQCFERGPCSRWSSGPWSACSTTCGPGFRFRNVTCVTTYSNTVLPDTQCPSPGPPEFQRCNIQPCRCEEPDFCRLIKGTEYCWNPRYRSLCCCTCGLPEAGRK